MTIIKRTEKKRVVEVTRMLTLGSPEQANDLLQRSQGGSVWNTAFIERFNVTFRERLTVLRRCRHAVRRVRALETGMYLVECTSNFCFPHHELSKDRHQGVACTPAMAAALTDHPWSLAELLGYRIAPFPCVAPKRSGCPRTCPLASFRSPRRALLRLRKGTLCSSPD